MKRMQWFADNYIPKENKLKVLDIGSYDVNGNYREIFESIGLDYTGLDMEKGPNVDIVPKDAYIWDEIKNDTYDVVISGQALEHIEFFWKTMENIVRVTKKGGMICIIAPNGFGEHRYPVDCWRFFTDGMVALARFFELEIIHSHTNAAPTIKNDEWYSSNEADSILVAQKQYSGNAKEIDLRGYQCVPGDHKKLSNGMLTYEDYIENKQKGIKEETLREEYNAEIGNRSNRKSLKAFIKAKITMIRGRVKKVIDREKRT